MSLQNKEKSKKKMKKPLKIVLIVLGTLVGVAAAATAAVLIMYSVGKGSMKNKIDSDSAITPPETMEDVTVNQDGSTVYYKGEKYEYNENAVPILLLGVDKYDFNDVEGIGYNGQSDAVYVAVCDTEKKSVSVLAVSRDSMVDVNRYSHDGAFLDTKRMQLCLAYAYGDGKDKSCRNVALSVSRLLCNVPVNYYAAADFAAVPVLNDAVGGVTVPEYTDDGMTPTGNTVTLNGTQAMRYLRWRYTPELMSNNSRIERQKNYIGAYVKKAVDKTKEDITFPLSLYNAVSDYMVTNIEASQITYLAANYLGGAENMKMYSIPGTVEEADGHAQFTPDAVTLYETVLELFYVKKAD